MHNKKSKNSGFIMLTRELIQSPSWHGMSINCKKLLDFLFEEHLRKGGKENGKLMATYDQLVNAGISRRLVHRTISEAEVLALIRVERGGRRGCVNEISIYTLTFISIFNNGYWKSPTNDWLKVNLEEIILFQRNHKIKTWLRHGMVTIPHPDKTQFHSLQ